MSEKEKPAKKAARKRVVKKATRSSQKSSGKDSSDEEASPGKQDTVPESAAQETDSTPTQSNDGDADGRAPEEDKRQEATPTIAVVEEDPEGSANDSKSTRSSQDRERKDKKKDSSDEGDKGEDRREGNRKRNRNRRGGNRERDEDSSNQPKRQVDADEVAEKGWEIYQAELEEEGVSLVDPRRGREIARRCLELATVFCEERDRFLKKQS